MSVKHLSAGSVEPPRVDGLLRVYSMVLCPYAKRARLVLKHKQLPHDIVNIHLTNKPEWYFKIHPKGQVPALVDGDKIVIESLDVAEYLDEKYPTNEPLLPSDAAGKAREQLVIKELVAPLTQWIGSVLHSEEPPAAEKAVDSLFQLLLPLNEELVKRGTPFFGGAKPGMVDFMLWPWAEFTPLVRKKLGVEKLPLSDDRLPNIRQWAKSMKEVPVIKELQVPPEVFIEFSEARKNNSLDYDAFSDKLLSNVKA
ncbi:hypothetical protein ABEB36_001440 [Hypothenemus hampei]|uniref:Uncharacterized protein n=1 Tax=Hypothenemus hampei TaxID=57062 RepID=A0ABD1FEK1_HYPHA